MRSRSDALVLSSDSRERLCGDQGRRYLRPLAVTAVKGCAGIQHSADIGLTPPRSILQQTDDISGPACFVVDPQKLGQR